MSAPEELEAALAEAQARLDATRIDVYPVGVLAALLSARRCVRHGWWKRAHREIRQEWCYLVRRVRAREWHDFKIAFNGYLAEINYPPPEIRQLTCGHGWTKRRAARRMGEYLWRDNRATP